MIVYHYTNLKSGISILQDGYLEVPDKEQSFELKPALWFSKKSSYDPSALNDFKEYGIIKSNSFINQIKTHGCMRFVYDNTNNLTSWRKFLNKSSLSKDKYEEIEKIFIKIGCNPLDWFCSFKNMSLRQFDSIEVYTDKWDWANEDNIQVAIRNAKKLN